MGVLGATAPVNISAEKLRWEADMDSYNPRFRYKDSAAALAGSNKVQASSALLHLAVGVLRSVIGKYGSERFTASPRRIPRLPVGDSVSTPRSSNIPTRELIWDPASLQWISPSNLGGNPLEGAGRQDGFQLYRSEWHGGEQCPPSLHKPPVEGAFRSAPPRCLVGFSP